MITVGQLNTVSAICFTLSLLVRFARRHRPRVPHRTTGGTLAVGVTVQNGPITIGGKL
jgi:hypothetical protein